MTSSTRRIQSQPRRAKRRRIKRRKREDKEEKGHRNWEGRGQRRTIKTKGEHCLPTKES